MHCLVAASCFRQQLRASTNSQAKALLGPVWDVAAILAMQPDGREKFRPGQQHDALQFMHWVLDTLPVALQECWRGTAEEDDAPLVVRLKRFKDINGYDLYNNTRRSARQLTAMLAAEHTSLPPALCVHVDARHTVDGRKSKCVFHVPTQLCTRMKTAAMDSIQSTVQHHDLRAILLHHGEGANEGHYVAVAQDGGDGHWYIRDQGNDPRQIADMDTYLMSDEVCMGVCGMVYEQRGVTSVEVIPMEWDRSDEGSDSCDSADSCCDQQSHGSDAEAMLVHEAGQSNDDVACSDTDCLTCDDVLLQVDINADDTQAAEDKADEEAEAAMRDGMSLIPQVKKDKDITCGTVSEIRNREEAVKQIAKALRDHPTLPPDREHPEQPHKIQDTNQRGVRYPRKHCACKGCTWYGESDAELEEHLSIKCEFYPRKYAGTHYKHHVGLHSEFVGLDAMELYNEAIAHKERENIPKVGRSVFRRTHEEFVSQHNSESVMAPMCLVCARVLMYNQADVDNATERGTCEAEIQWHAAMKCLPHAASVLLTTFVSGMASFLGSCQHRKLSSC